MKKNAFSILVAIVAALALILAIIGVVRAPAGGADEIVELGTSNFDTIVLSQDLTVGDDLTVADDVTITDDVTLDVLTVGGKLTVNDQGLIDGDSDEIQLTVQGYTTQTNNLLVLENSAGSDQFVVDGSGNVTTMGDFDEAVLVDGEADAVQLTAQGWTTQTNSILVVETSAGSDVFTVSNTGAGDFASTLQYGANNLYPLGYASSGYQIVYGSSSITTTATAVHGLTTVTWALCVLAEDPGTGSGDAALCSVSVSANVVTIKLWQDDFSAATEATVDVNWLVIGTP